MTDRITGAEALVRCLEAEGVDTVFGYPGGVALPIFDALYDSKQIRTILPRHEQGAMHMGDGYARATGRVAPVIVTSGPGATNTDHGSSRTPTWTRSPWSCSPRRSRRRCWDRCVPGVRHHRHHPADHQAQLPAHERGRAARDRQGGVPHRHDRASRSGAHRHPGRREQGRAGLRVPGARQPAGLQAHVQGAQQADQAGGLADLEGPQAAALRGRRRDRRGRAQGAQGPRRAHADPGRHHDDGQGRVSRGPSPVDRHARHARRQVHQLRDHRDRPAHRGGRALRRSRDRQALGVREQGQDHPRRRGPGRDRQEQGGRRAHRGRREERARGARRRASQDRRRAAHRGVGEPGRRVAQAVPAALRARARRCCTRSTWSSASAR